MKPETEVLLSRVARALIMSSSYTLKSVYEDSPHPVTAEARIKSAVFLQEVGKAILELLADETSLR